MRNDISAHLLVHTIHCRLGIHASAKRMGLATPVTKYMTIEDVEVGKSVEKMLFSGISEYEKEAFGSKKRILSHSLDFMGAYLSFCAGLKDYSQAFTTFRTQTIRGEMLSECMQYITNYQKPVKDLIQNYDVSIFDKIENDEHYQKFANFYRKHTQWR